MGCICSGTDTINKNNKVVKRHSLSNMNNASNNRSIQSRRDNINDRNNINNNNRSSYSNTRINNLNNNTNASRLPNNNTRRVNNTISNDRVNNPTYIPYLQSANDPTFNMKETKEQVGEGIKKMKGYVCYIEKDDLDKKRNDFWSSRFEGNVEVWELLRQLCTGEMNSDEIKDILDGAGLSTYAGCINVVYDTQGNLYEIPNYCIHDPSEWDILKYKIKKPDEESLIVKLRYICEENEINISNLTQILALKQGLVKAVKFGNYEPGTIDPDRIRLFHRGKEMKDNDYIYMHNVNKNADLMMMIKPL